MIKKKKSLFIKLGILVSAFIGVVCSLVVPTHAYTLSNDFVYSSNGLNIQSPSTTTFGTDSLTNSTIRILSELDNNNSARAFKLQLFNGTTFDRELYTTDLSESQVWQFEAFDIANGQTITTMRNFYGNYYIRFARNGAVADDYVEYKIGDILDYYSQFIDSNTYFNRFGVCLKVQAINIAVSGSILLGYVGVYFSNDLPTESTYEPYGIYGNFDENYINTYSYNQGVLSQQSTIRDLQNQINNMDRQIQNLSNQLNLAQSTQMRSLLWTIAATPFESFKTIWDVNIWGLNIGGIVLGGLLALLIIYLIKKVWK